MQCITCKAEISSIFKHAIIKNECPACGKSIMNEESLALIEHLKNTLSNGVTLREETAQELAMVLFSTYSISLRKNSQVFITPQITLKQENVKIASPSKMNEISKANGNNVVTAKEILQEGISDLEREKIMEDVVKERYGLIDQITDTLENIPPNMNDNNQNSSLFTEGNINPVLEQERLARLAKQKQVLEGGGGILRRRG